MCANLAELRDRDGIDRFGGAVCRYAGLALAAGPSLDRILPRLSELRKRAVIIAVDTAVRAACAPEWNPTSSSSSTPNTGTGGTLTDFLPVEYPDYRVRDLAGGVPLPLRAIYLCSSLFPLGQFMESRIGAKGTLGAADRSRLRPGTLPGTRDRAHFHGSPDLGFPDKKTHFTGSISRNGRIPRLPGSRRRKPRGTTPFMERDPIPYRTISARRCSRTSGYPLRMVV
jgi:hypothetical protein